MMMMLMTKMEFLKIWLLSASKIEPGVKLACNTKQYSIEMVLDNVHND